MTELSVSKSLLAKLLASENITVVHRNVSTASFDLKNRALTLPIWNDMDGDLYDLLVGHEIGHALYTPEQGWHDAVTQNKKKSFKGFLNVIEDARIEKLAKRKYPGLGKSFAAGYKELYERDLFGIKKLPDVNKLNLIDRINIRFKVGAHVIVKFSDAEMEYVREIEAVETWEQVEDIANRVYAYVKENESDKLNSQTDLDQLINDLKEQLGDEFPDQDDASDDDMDYLDDMDGSGADDDMDAMDKSDGESTGEGESEDETTGAENGKTVDSGDALGDEEDEPKSITDSNFRQRERQLVNESGKVSVFTLPEANLDKILLKNKIVISHLEKFIERQLQREHSPYYRIGMTYDKLAAKCVAKFNKNNSKYVMHILKEFEMRKRAYQYARTTQARTGELNMNVLHNYKFSNDLFKKMNIIGKAKNHGMILFLDMSGSMSEIMRNTVEQLLVLVSFCKLANIPFDVYGFSNDHYNPNFKYFHYGIDEKQANEAIPDELAVILNEVGGKFTSDPNDMRCERSSAFHLKHLIGSDLSAIQYRKSFNALAIVANEYGRYQRQYSWQPEQRDHDHGAFEDWTNGGFGLNGTPTIQMLLASRQIINDFKAKHKRDIVNVIHLTDGDGDSGVLQYPQGYNTPNFNRKVDGVLYLVDKKTKKKVKVVGEYSPMQVAVTDLVAKATGCKHIGFRLIEGRYAKNTIRDLSYMLSAADFDKVRKSYKENNFIEVPSHGYSKFFFIGASDRNITEDKLEISDGMSKAKITSAFKKTLNSKKSNRVLVSKFSEEIAA